MASKFVVPDRDQSFFEAVSYRGVLGEDHPVWTVISVVEGMDLSGLYARYEGDPQAGGRPAFDPPMLLALLLFGYCEGKRSSRSLEEACQRDWAYRAICGGLTPDHATIARFRAGLDGVLESLFAQVLAVCAQAGLVQLGVVALDGTRMGAAASMEANRTGETLERMQVEARRMLDEAAAADLADTCDGEAGSRGSTRRQVERVRRMERIRKAQQVVAAAQATRQAEEKKRGKPKRPVANVTDPESRLQKTRNGFIQGYNAQAVVTGDQVVIAAEVVSEQTDVQMLDPMLTNARACLDAAGVTDTIGVGLADAGYWSQANAELGSVHGIDLLIATTKTRQVGTPNRIDDASIRRDARRQQVVSRVDAGEITVTDAATQLELSTSYVSVLVSRYRRHGNLASAATLARRQMQEKLSQPPNRDLYRQRGWLIEGSFAHTKTHRNTRRFLRHGLTACNAEWKLINLAGNLLKLHRHRTNPTLPTPTAACNPSHHNQPPTPRNRRRNRLHHPHRKHHHENR